MKLLIVLFLNLIFASSVFAAAPTELPITDPAKSIIVNSKNSTFKIALRANPTTGFSWFLKAYDANIITPVSAKFIPPTQAIPGRGGVTVWTFRVNSKAFAVPTITSIQLAYVQAWAIPKNTIPEEFLVVITP